VPIVLEGYPPPRDPRLKLLQVTPDPGVIEVNIHPAHALGRAGRATPSSSTRRRCQTRLSAREVHDRRPPHRHRRRQPLRDGRRHAGGSARSCAGPTCCASLLAYWHNHPSLSYLFSGLFIGPTSQAPRVDEARNDQLYELEIALDEIAQPRRTAQTMPPWLVDRTLRNMLVDVTGNTHRSEFCIDKLYSPDSRHRAAGPAGAARLRDAAARAHEHRPAAAAARAGGALLAARPTAALVPLGHRAARPLHAAHFVAAGLLTMCSPTCARPALPSTQPGSRRTSSSASRMVGECHARGRARCSLRSALEPWHVMGEEGAAGGTGALCRFVARAHRGAVSAASTRAATRVTVQRPRPAAAADRALRANIVAGVRYSAWKPPIGLHPTIGVHAPLTFDLVDTWMQRSLGGCQLPCRPPGGLQLRHPAGECLRGRKPPPGPLLPPWATHRAPLAAAAPTVHVAGSREFPFTLDLRRV
jgi:uncharacterized protein (DUF2126 family)